MNFSTLIQRPIFLPEFSEWEKLQGQRIAITGHRGILGSLLMERMLESNVSVEAFPGDVTDGAAVSNWIKDTKPDAMLHLASIVPLQEVEASPVTAMHVNATALLDIVSAIQKFAPRCWLFLGSTSHVYPSSQVLYEGLKINESSSTLPISLYGATKLAGEKIVAPLSAHFEIQLCIGRIFSYFHERQASSFLIPNLVKRINDAGNGGTIEVRDSNSIRDFLYANVVVDALLYLCVRRSSVTVNIGSGQPNTVGAIAEAVVKSLQMEVYVKHIKSSNPTGLVADIELLKSIIGFV